MVIAGIEIGPGHPCRTVAEMSNNHNGKVENAYHLIAAAKVAGADFVKFQCRTATGDDPPMSKTINGDRPAFVEMPASEGGFSFWIPPLTRSFRRMDKNGKHWQAWTDRGWFYTTDAGDTWEPLGEEVSA